MGEKKISVTEGVVHLEQLNEQLEQLDRQRCPRCFTSTNTRAGLCSRYGLRRLLTTNHGHVLDETPRVKPDLGLMAKELNLSEGDISAVMSRVRELVEQQRS